MKNTIYSLILFGMTYCVISCSPAKGDHTGHEYMMDMGHSIAYEANQIDEFFYNRWNPDQYYQLSIPRLPVHGTIARGSVGLSNYSASNLPQAYADAFAIESVNGSVPYYYKDNEADRARAIQEIIKNPFPITKSNLESGKKLFNIYCAICHGDKGDGSGYLVRDGGKYPAQPANLISDDFINSSNGRFYHAIMYGKNMMGNYADRLSYQERWQVIQYIRSLQAVSKGKVYTESENNFNNTDFIAMGDGIKHGKLSVSEKSDSVVITKIHVGTSIDSTKIIQKK